MKLILPSISNQTCRGFQPTLQRISIIFNPTLTPKGIKQNISNHATGPLSVTQVALSQTPHLFKSTEKLPLVSVAYDHTLQFYRAPLRSNNGSQFN